MARRGKRLEHLTPEQEALLPVVRDEWLAVGLSTERADRPAAEAAARLAYEKAGLDAPRLVIWLRSPLEGSVGAAMLPGLLSRLAERDGQVWDQVWGQVGGQVWGQVRDQVRGQVGDQVRDQVWGQVRDQVRDQVWGQVRDQVWGQVRMSLWGQHDAGWLGWADAFGRLGIDTSLSLGLQGVARSAGWWWAFRDAVILTERPLVLNRDVRGRLHCETGPAIAYPDGFGVWAWHGVRVPRDVIETGADELTIGRVLEERNAEVRRVLIERMGHARYLAKSGARQVGRDDWGTLWRAERHDDTPIVVVEVVNSTPEPDGSARTYHLRVHPAFGEDRTEVAVPLVTLGDDGRELRRRTVTVPRTPHAAIASTFGLTPTEYQPAEQT